MSSPARVLYCAKYYQDRKDDPEFRQKRRHHKNIWYRSLKGKFAMGKHNAKTRGLAWTLTLEEFEPFIKEPCYYCNEYNLPETCCGLDRLDNRKGYILGNVKSCCKVCNNVKGLLEAAGFLWPRTVELTLELRSTK
jgi:hypothetical protein